MSLAVSLAQRPWTFELVEELERQAKRKFEFVEGAPRAMADASDAHHLLSSELMTQLGLQLSRGPHRGRCVPFGSDAKVRVRDPAAMEYRYPDVSVFCGERERHPGTETLYTNPTVLFEIISPGSGPVDEVVKRQEYTAIASLRAYVVVAEDARRITMHRRGLEGEWATTIQEQGTIELPGVPAELDVDALYAALD